MMRGSLSLLFFPLGPRVRPSRLPEREALNQSVDSIDSYFLSFVLSFSLLASASEVPSPQPAEVQFGDV